MEVQFMEASHGKDFIQRITSAQHRTCGWHFLGTLTFLNFSQRFASVCRYIVATHAGLDVYYSPVSQTVFLHYQYIQPGF